MFQYNLGLVIELAGYRFRHAEIFAGEGEEGSKGRDFLEDEDDIFRRWVR